MASRTEISSIPHPSLSLLPRQVIAKLTPGPYLHAHLISTPSSRPNGRSLSHFRPPAINTSSLRHCAGSAVVRTGDTAAVCGIRAELLHAHDIPDTSVLKENRPTFGSESEADELADLGLLVPNVELSTGCAPQHLPGGAPSSLAQSLSYRVLTLLLRSQIVDADNLRVSYTPPKSRDVVADVDFDDGGVAEEPTRVTKAFWTLHISLLVLALDGPPLGALWTALVAAIRDTRLPRAWWDAEKGMVVCSPEVCESRRLSVRGCPWVGIWGVFRTPVGAGKKRNWDEHGEGNWRRKGEEFWMLADPNGLEEELCQETVTLAVDADVFSTVGEGELKVLMIEKSGGGMVGLEQVEDALVQAGQRWRQWRQAIIGDMDER